jgi:hypothetical protein
MDIIVNTGYEPTCSVCSRHNEGYVTFADGTTFVDGSADHNKLLNPDYILRPDVKELIECGRLKIIDENSDEKDSKHPKAEETGAASN